MLPSGKERTISSSCSYQLPKRSRRLLWYKNQLLILYRTIIQYYYTVMYYQKNIPKKVKLGKEKRIEYCTASYCTVQYGFCANRLLLQRSFKQGNGESVLDWICMVVCECWFLWVQSKQASMNGMTHRTFKNCTLFMLSSSIPVCWQKHWWVLI